jgi:hypothetical protein
MYRSIVVGNISIEYRSIYILSIYDLYFINYISVCYCYRKHDVLWYLLNFKPTINDKIWFCSNVSLFFLIIIRNFLVIIVMKINGKSLLLYFYKSERVILRCYETKYIL